MVLNELVTKNSYEFKIGNVKVYWICVVEFLKKKTNNFSTLVFLVFLVKYFGKTIKLDTRL